MKDDLKLLGLNGRYSGICGGTSHWAKRLNLAELCLSYDGILIHCLTGQCDFEETEEIN